MSNKKECFYEVLGVSKNASQSEVKKAYHQLALKLHPDKNKDDKDGEKKFQSLVAVYEVLGDPARRKLYDETGCTDESSFDFSLVDFFKGMKRVSEDDISTFMTEYRGSEEEHADLLKLYERFRGKMSRVFEWLLCSVPELDSHRFRDTLRGAIKSGKVKSYGAFESWSKTVDAKPPPAEDPLARFAGGKGPNSTKAKSAKADSSTMDLVAAIQARRQGAAASLLDSLAAKYGGGDAKGRKGAKRKLEDPLSDEQFEEMRAKVVKGRTDNKKINARGKNKKSVEEPAGEIASEEVGSGSEDIVESEDPDTPTPLKKARKAKKTKRTSRRS